MKEVYQVNVYISQSEYTEPRYYESASDAHHTEAVFLSKEDAKKFCAELSKALTGKDAYAQVEAVYLYNDLTDRLTDQMLKIYKVGSVVSAVVVGITDKGIFSRLENTYGKMDVFTDYSLYPRERIPKLYSRVTVRINGINEKKMQIWGPIINEEPEIAES